MTGTAPGRMPLVALAVLGVGKAASAQAPGDLLDLSIEELSDLRITTVSRVEESLRSAPAAVFVITAEAIRRSGVTSIPEALRLAPGVEVARRNAHAWSISIRGFNSDLSNKLLVLIDGRSVYSPLYAGVFWDVQDTLLADIDRIEVISGPGGTLWGANAVNGVINIITRPAAETVGGYVEAGTGVEDRAVTGFRYGGTLGDSVAARVYVKHVDRDSTESFAGGDGVDAMTIGRAGFRLDWDFGGDDGFTLQGDVYDGSKDGEFLGAFTRGTLPAGTSRGEVDIAGGNLLGRWTRQLDGGSDYSLQVYYDYTRRDIPNTYGEKRDTLDVDFQHHVALGARNDVIWGLGARGTRDDLDNSEFASFDPARRTDRTLSAFVQDELTLVDDRLFLTLGSKFEDNDYTGSEVQPNVRLTWLMDDRRTFWSAVSRAVRIPSRLDADLHLSVPLSSPEIPFPIYVDVDGSDSFGSEELEAYEAGYRTQLGERLSLDVAAFRNDYDELQTREPRDPVLVLVPPLPYAVLPIVLENRMRGTSTGGTFTANWQALETWRLRFQYSHIDLDLELDATSADTSSAALAGNSPEHQLGIHSFLDLPRNLSLYTGVRYVDELPSETIDAYTAVDLNLSWRPRDNLEASLAVRNLTDDEHAEFRMGDSNVLERAAFVKATWTF